jgi:predicted transcriptional regulator of viral defense system
VNFLDFRTKFFDLAGFSTDQVYAWQPGFDRNNFSRWVVKNLIIRLRQGFYTFPEYLGKPDYVMYFANRIYRPSYVSLHTALAYYGFIPEGVVQVTSVTSLKTASFCNTMGEYYYHTMKPELLFGFAVKPFDEGRSLQLAEPEKALLDLLYLYPAYNTENDMEELRLDNDFLHNDLRKDLLEDYTSRFKSKVLEQRIKTLFKTYGL